MYKTGYGNFVKVAWPKDYYWAHSMGPQRSPLIRVVVVVVVVDIDARVRQYRHLVNGRAAARSGEWAQHFSNASCINQTT